MWVGASQNFGFLWEQTQLPALSGLREVNPSAEEAFEQPNMRRAGLKSTQKRISRLAVSLFGPSRTLVLKRTMSHRLLARARVAGRLGGRYSCGFRTTS